MISLSRRGLLGLAGLAAGGRMTTPYGARQAVRGLGHPTKQGISDASGLAENVNPYLPGTGWDVIFRPDDFGVPLAEFEAYHIALDGPIGSSVAILIDRIPWDFVNQGWANGWDPAQPMLLKSGVTLAFCWNVAFAAGPYNRTTNIRPVVTLWLRTPAAVTGFPEA